MDQESIRCSQSHTPINDLLSFSIQPSSTGSSPLPVSSCRASASGFDANLMASLRGLRSWNPWTNRRTGGRHQQPLSQPQPEVQTTQKAAGNLYDSMIRAERLEAARAAHRATLSRNNNTNDLDGGLRDIQRHTGTDGQRTTVITRLASLPAAGNGGVLDVNFVIDSNSSNTPDTFNRKGRSSDESNDTSDGNAGRQPTSREPQKGTIARDRPIAQALDMQETSGESSDRQQRSRESLDSSAEMQQQPPGLDSQTSPEPSQQSVVTSPEEGDEGEGDEGEGDENQEQEEEDAPMQSEEKQGTTSARKKLSICHLQKEGVLIGCMNVFADVMRKEFVILLTDSVVAAFLLEPSQFRAIATRTGCEIEVTRRILNRRIGMHRWVKYLVITIKGPNMTAIDQCDRLMVKLFPPYKMRKEYLEQAPVSLYVKESYPDNTNLYFNFQRTGPVREKLGELRLQTPFAPSKSRPLENTPWKYADWRLFKGVLEPRNLAAEHVIQHVYPEWGTEPSNYLDNAQKWELAGDIAIEMEKMKNLERSVRVKNRKLEAEALFVENA